MKVGDEILRAGECASLDELRQRGASEHHIKVAVQSGSIVRLRRGWYGRALSIERTSAGRAGGAITCVSALRIQGAWTMPDEAVHVRVRRGTMVRRSAGVVVHWSPDRVDVAQVDDPWTAIACVISCAEQESAVVTLDSAINRRLISVGDVTAICSSTSRGRAIARALDPASESGLETLARLRLRRLQVRVRTQVEIEWVGRIDILVGDRLVIELDGRAWHDRPGDFEADRRRDRELVALGYLVLRASYAQVMGEWTVIEDQILGLVRSRKHLWPRRSR